MTGKLSTTLRDLQRQIAQHAKSGMPLTAKDAATLAASLGACAGYAAMLEGKFGNAAFYDPASATFAAIAEAANPHDKSLAAPPVNVLRFPPRVRVVVTQSVQPPEGDSA